jgi:hypothetical protein
MLAPGRSKGHTFCALVALDVQIELNLQPEGAHRILLAGVGHLRHK